MTVEAELDEADLWARVRCGDAAAFAELYLRHSRGVYNHCFRRTGSWTLAEDLTSVVFLETWRRRDLIELVEVSLLPFLLGTANNLIYKQTRTLLRHRRALARLPRSTTLPDHADEAAERVDAEARMRGVLDSIQQLPRVEQDAVALCIWAGLSYADAAIAMGVPVGTVRSRLSRARGRLREASAESTPMTVTEEEMK